MFHTAYFHYIVISLLPLLCGGKIRVPFPSLVFNHRPRRGPMLTQQLEYGAVQQSITSKWALLDIWQHSGSYTQLPPVLLSLSAPRLNTEKSYSFIFIFFSWRMFTISKPYFENSFRGPVQLYRPLLNLSVAVSFKHKQYICKIARSAAETTLEENICE